MPVNPVLYSELTGSASYLPIIGDSQLKFTFWQASQRSNALKRFCGLVYQKNLGEGASFTVDLYRNEAGDPKFPREVAVKTLKLNPTLTRDLLNEDVNLYCLLLELQILLHEPLSRHRNIINVLGIDWNSSTYGSPIPLLIVEYSTLGPLTIFLRSHPGLSITIKGKLCLDIAQRLKMIHDYGIVHGDVKLDNVLIFGDEKDGFVAKITDFGCSITGFEPQERGIYRGTKSYWAPELKDTESSTLPDLQRCDVYSFGLCVLEMLNDGERSDGRPEGFEEYAHTRDEPLLEALKIFQHQEDTMIGDDHAKNSLKNYGPRP
ncbi:kinase-like protein [Stipitochalara longipes BDJ]|nr:kinase-like protein [Stipitochalara longipes BDJ]